MIACSHSHHISFNKWIFTGNIEQGNTLRFSAVRHNSYFARRASPLTAVPWEGMLKQNHDTPHIRKSHPKSNSVSALSHAPATNPAVYNAEMNGMTQTDIWCLHVNPVP